MDDWRLPPPPRSGARVAGDCFRRCWTNLVETRRAVDVDVVEVLPHTTIIEQRVAERRLAHRHARRVRARRAINATRFGLVERKPLGVRTEARVPREICTASAQRNGVG